MKRRDFLLQSSGLFFAGAIGQIPLNAFGQDFRNKLLILVELKGGNDGLNTAVPLDQFSVYKSYRPQIHHSELSLSQTLIGAGKSTLGLHPNLKQLKKLFDAKDLSVLTGVGMENSTLSHFGMIRNWERGSEIGYLPGWSTQVVNNLKGKKENPGYVLGSVGLGPLVESQTKVIKNFNDFKRVRLSEVTNIASGFNESIAHIIKTRYSAKSLASLNSPSININNYDLPEGDFGEQIATALQVLSAGERVPFIKLSLGGFDTHFNQVERHNDLMTGLDKGLLALTQGLKDLGLYDDSMVLTYSEFGRNPKENGSLGTDHGTASIQFVLGGSVAGGQIFGEYPRLDDLKDEKHLKPSLDFRSVYARVAYDFFKLNSSQLRTTTPRPEFLENQFYQIAPRFIKT